MRTVLCATRHLLAVCCLLLLTATSGLGQGNWVQLSANFRHLQGVQMLDFNTIIAVGGNRTNDPITTVLRSNNRGQTWDIIIDTPHSPWLQSVHFPSLARGFAAGYDGMVIRTDDGGISWDTLQLPGNAALRDYNDVYFTSETEGFLVGGNQANNSIRTILKTVDGGDSWQILKDDLGPWLKAVQFVSATVGFASGELGILLKTTNGGDTWSDISPQGNLANRHYNDIRFADEMNGFAVGGQEKNDSIRTILRTGDGGISWQPLVDAPSTWINAIEISPSGDLIAVGNDSTILTSTDGGDTWEKEIIPASINWGVHLNAVDFIYGSLGVVVGDYGQILLYEGTLPSAPTVTVNSASITSTDSVRISGTVNANGDATDVFFDYGPTPSFGTTIYAEPSVVTGSSPTYVEALISGITPGIYYYRLRAENDGGSTHSETRQFYIGNFYEDANLDFEHWTEFTTDVLEDWITLGSPYQSLSYDGSTAVTIGQGTSSATSAIVLGDIRNDRTLGGIPVSSTPDSVVGYFKYEITPSTEGVVFLGLKKDGELFTYELYTITGSSGGSFERLSFPVAYAGIEMPDTIMLAFANNNVFVESEIESPLNVVSIDNISVISSTPVVIPNFDFERWETVTSVHPTNWVSSDTDEEPFFNETVFRTEDAQHGNYALTLKNHLLYNESGTLYTGNQIIDERAKFSVVGRHATFNGYYKYEMLGYLDTVDIHVQIYLNGAGIGGGHMRIGESASSYTPFEIELGYSTSIVPDSASIEFRIGNDSLLGPSVLYIDNLSFDGFVAPYVPPLITSVEEPFSDKTFSVLVYPNPSTGNVVVETSENETIDQLDVYDLNGRLILQKRSTSNLMRLDMSDHPVGIYFLRIFSISAGQWQVRKLVLN